MKQQTLGIVNQTVQVKKDKLQKEKNIQFHSQAWYHISEIFQPSLIEMSA